MSLVRCSVLLVLVLLGSSHGGGHGGHHYDHLRIYLPEFIHHDHHTKVITIHHHHHKPKHHHHHHHHLHHPKPPVLPYSHRVHHQKKMHHVSKGHSVSNGLRVTPVHHVHPVHHAGFGPQKQIHDYPGYQHFEGIHQESPYKYDPSVTSISSFSPAAPPITSSVPMSFATGIPQVRGVQHTVKQLTVFDSLTGTRAVPNTGGSTGYQVTEQGEESDTADDTFTLVNPGHRSFQGSYGYFREADFTPNPDNYLTQPPAQSTAQSLDSFPTSPQLTSISDDGIESYSGSINSDFPSAFSSDVTSAISPEPPVFDSSEFGDTLNTVSSDGEDLISFIGESPDTLKELEGV